MNRSIYFNFIEEKLNGLAQRIEVRGKLNLLDLNIHSEYFYVHFFNLMFSWKLENLNVSEPNAPSIDLIDNLNKVIIQVSATATYNKVSSALSKADIKHKGYQFKFISIARDAKEIREKTYANPSMLIFSPKDDIYDVPGILKKILQLEIAKLKEIHDFLKLELQPDVNLEKVDSNLTAIILILSKEDWNLAVVDPNTNAYEIEAKVQFNQLNAARALIDDYKIHHHRIEKIYSEFNKQGINRSTSILDGIRSLYLCQQTRLTADERFFDVINLVTLKIRASANYRGIPEEELALCSGILVVDAFIRCKIFKNPNGGADANS